jgi:membrane protein YdbS with pleckstrin-like domain
VAYPEKILADDEQVVEHLHPHWITLVPATLWFIAICAAGGVGIAYAGRVDGTGRTIIIGLIVVVGLALLSWLTFTPWMGWRTTHYVFTTHRVLIRRGVLRHVGRDISLQRINDVGFSQSLWDRIVKAGTLTIESAGEQGQESLRYIPRSDAMQQLLNRLIEQDGERRARLAHGGAPPGYQQPPPGYQQPPPGYQQPPPGYQQPPPGYQQPPPGYQRPPPTQQYPPQQ